MTGRIPGAPPTAPGGMSEAALEAELAEHTDLDDFDLLDMSWPDKIQAVIQSRLDRNDGKPEVREPTPAPAKKAAKKAAPKTKPVEPEPVEPEPTVDDAECEECGDKGGRFVYGMVLCDVCEALAEPDDSDDLLDDEPTTEEKAVVAAAEAEAVLDDIEAEFADQAEVHAEAKVEQAAVEAAIEPLFLGLPEVADYIFDGHAGAGPSGAERWMNCTASLSAARAFLETLTPNQQHQFAGANTAARQGTTAHAAAEVELRTVLGEVDATEAENALLELAINPPVADEAYDEEMAQYITEYVDFVKQYVDAGHEVLVEARLHAAVPLTVSDLVEDDVYVITGSGDTVALPTPEDPVLTVVDLKYGEGLDVDVESNPQVRIYGLGALAMLADEEGNLPDIERIDYVIVQPRLGGIKVWTESVTDLVSWRDDVLAPALTQALGGPEHGATFNPGELQCQWCPVRGACPALAAQRIEAGAELFDTIVETEYEHGAGALPDSTLLSNERLASLLAQVTALVDIKDDLKAEAQRRLHRGQHVPGFKMVSYTPKREWTPDAALALDLDHGDVNLSLAEKRTLWKQTLITPTQAVKMLGEKAGVLDEHVIVPDKRPIIAPEGDRRKTWEGKPPEQMFTVIED